MKPTDKQHQKLQSNTCLIKDSFLVYNIILMDLNSAKYMNTKYRNSKCNLNSTQYSIDRWKETQNIYIHNQVDAIIEQNKRQDYLHPLKWYKNVTRVLKIIGTVEKNKFVNILKCTEKLRYELLLLLALSCYWYCTNSFGK